MADTPADPTRAGVLIALAVGIVGITFGVLARAAGLSVARCCAMSLLVFSLLVVVERRKLLPAASYAVALTLFAYWLFGIALKAPLERGLLWF